MKNNNSSSYTGAIKEAIRNIAGDQKERILICEVISVDITNYLVDVLPVNGMAELTDIKLCPSGTHPSLITIPSIGQKVFVSLINDSDGYVCGGEFESVELGGNESNAVRFDELQSAFNQLKQDHDSLVAAHNALLNVVKTWTVVPSDGGAALKAFAAPLLPESSSTANISPAEVNNVKLGV